jgi:2-polyprenyl-6-methoxyphenol hydroxylase-like FAD-dependent oxidoreductase
MYLDDQPSALRGDTAHDVIVVGAQAAGAATAMLLARRHLRTLLLDHVPHGPSTPCTHALMRGGVVQLSRWGLLDKIIAAGVPPVRRTTFRYGDENLIITVKPSHGVDALYAPHHSSLRPVLLGAALQAGVEVVQTRVVDMIERHGRIVGVRATGSDGELIDLRAAIVIGADGIDSTIAQRVGATFTHVGQHASASASAYWSDLATDGYEWNLQPNACSAVIPTSNGEACIFVSASPARIGDGGIDVIRDLVAQGAPRLAERLATATMSSARASSWKGHHGYIRRSHGPGWALVGAAGYFTDPISAHGLTDALRDAELLARAVAEGFDSSASLDKSLENYERTRDGLGLPLFAAVDRIAGQQWDDAEIAQLVLQMNSAIADEAEALVALGSEAAS